MVFGSWQITEHPPQNPCSVKRGPTCLWRGGLGQGSTSSLGPHTDKLSRVTPSSLVPPTLAGVSLVSLQTLGDRAAGGGAR